MKATLLLFRKTLFIVTLLLLVPFPAGSQNLSDDPEALANLKKPEEILQEADSIFAEVSRLRGEPIRRPVAKKFENKAFFRSYYERLLDKQYPPERKRDYEKAYALFGFLPPGADLIQTYLDSFMTAVEGLYDPDTRTLYVADWINSEDQEETMAHELTHALQDQYFGLQAFMDEGAGLSMDSQFARSGVMEGEAVAIALNYQLEDRKTDFTQLVNIADWVRINNMLKAEGKRAFGEKAALNEVISFPYVYGPAFLQKYVKAYGWKGMDYLFRNPPTSTHQIMHPETFFPHRHNPVAIRIDDLSRGVLEGNQEIWDDTMGEYGLLTLLSQHVPESTARAAVSGWEGDRVQVYEDKATRRLLLVGYVVFNSTDSADEFFRAYRDFLNVKYSINQFRRSDDTIHWAGLQDGSTEVYVEYFGRRAVFIEGTPAGLTAKVRGALWDVVPVKPH